MKFAMKFTGAGLGSKSVWSVAILGCAIVLARPVAAADVGDLLRDARRVTRDTTAIVRQIKSITTPTTSKRKDDLPKDGAAVVFYSASWCGYCTKARAYMDQNGIAYQEYDTERTERGRADYAKLSGRGVPILLIGDDRMDGWSEAKFRKLYKGAAAEANAQSGKVATTENGAGAPDVGAMLVPKIDNVAVFASASQEAEVIARLNKSDEVVAMEPVQGNFVKIQSASASGWVDVRLMNAKSN